MDVNDATAETGDGLALESRDFVELGEVKAETKGRVFGKYYELVGYWSDP